MTSYVAAFIERVWVRHQVIQVTCWRCPTGHKRPLTTLQRLRRSVALHDRLPKFGIFSNRQLADLYFVGIRGGVPTPRYAGVRVAHLNSHFLMLLGKERYLRERPGGKQYIDARWHRPQDVI